MYLDIKYIVLDIKVSPNSKKNYIESIDNFIKINVTYVEFGVCDVMPRKPSILIMYMGAFVELVNSVNSLRPPLSAFAALC